MLAERSLAAAYPVVQQLLGEESFADLARALWHAHPPTQGDLARWGDALPSFLAGSAQLQQEPYLADVATLEWALHRSSTLADQELDLTTLGLLTSEDPAELKLVLAAGCSTAQSHWPVASIWSAHQEHAPSFVEVGQLLKDRVAEDAVVWRQGWKPRARRALNGECALLQALLAGATLAHALDAATELDFAKWLPLAVQSGLVLSVARTAAASQQ
jgi:hypothetical protein